MWPFRGKSERGCGNQAYVDNWSHNHYEMSF